MRQKLKTHTDRVLNFYDSNKNGPLVKRCSIEKLPEKVRDYVIQHDITLTRNSKCICGSNKRFKNCCMKKIVD